jgi:plasmid stabilization system protein ParE
MRDVSYALTPSAKADLEEIWCFIAEDNPEEADRLEADIYKACEMLTTHPEMGSKRPTWTNKPVRFWPVRQNYLIVYVPESVPLEILRIFNAARDVPKLMADA